MKEKVDAVTLTEIIDRCLDHSMDGRFTPAQRGEFLIAAKRFRGLLLNLLSARFEEDTPGLDEANADLAGVNADLKEAAADLAQVAQTLADLTRLVGALDTLLGVAGQFL